MDCDFYLVMNGDQKVSADYAGFFTNVFYRENTGYNLAAWDFAWRQLGQYDYFLFLQDDCIILKKNWLRDFYDCFKSEKKCGLVGEFMSWDMPWAELIAGVDEPKISEDELDAADVANCARFYRKTLLGWNVPIGDSARHLASIIHFTSSEILKKVDGYNHPTTYREAIASEIGFSRKIEAAGYKLAQVGKQRFSRIGHREWFSDSPTGFLMEKLFQDAPDRLRRIFGRK